LAARLTAPALAALVVAFSAAAAPLELERAAAGAARQGDWPAVLSALDTLRQESPERYADGRFDYLAARALAAIGRAGEALPRFERYVSPGDLFDVPARLAAAQIRLGTGDGDGALDLLLPLLQRKGTYVARRALRIVLDALETRNDPATLARLLSAKPPAPPRERRRLAALRAEAQESAGAAGEAAALRQELLREAKRDDAAAIVLAREMRGADVAAIPDRLLLVLIDTARAQRDLDLAQRLAVERVRRASSRGDADERFSARFDLGRVYAARGRFREAAEAFRALLIARPAGLKPPRRRTDNTPGTPGFFTRVRFNLAAALEKLGDTDAAAAELLSAEKERSGPWRLAMLQRARILTRAGAFGKAEAILSDRRILREPGRIEGLLALVLRRAETGDGAGARNSLEPVVALARAHRLPEPWKSELPFWHGRVAEASGDIRGALSAYARLLADRPASVASEIALSRARALPEAPRAAFIRDLRGRGEAALTRGEARGAVAPLLPAVLLGDATARDLLRLAYRALPGYSEVLLAPELSDETLPTLCGDAGACRLIQLGLAEEAAPIVRDASRLDSLLGCMAAARLAEQADAGPFSLVAAEALGRKVPADFLLDLAPLSIRRALAPRPFDELVAETAKESGVPHDLLYGVMRQESRFDREAASPAAARGLMQLTLPTAGEAARELHEEPPAYMQLYEPARSLRLGARTLRGLLARFGGDAVETISAYNAGAGQTTLWVGAAKSPSEALLAAITYAETRTYLRRALAHRALYRLAEPPASQAVR
jgi:soluble lytic murein transglycosylase-like protein/thioredoxin-like negative regulator of GroEL